MNRLVFVSLAQFLLVFMIGCSGGDTAESKRKEYGLAISEVYDKIAKSYAELQADVEKAKKTFGAMGWPGAANKHLVRLSNIDATRCPPEFQMAFDEFLLATKEFTNVVESNQGWSSLIANFVTMGNHSIIPSMMAEGELKQQYREAEFKMKRIAIQYGVTFAD